jgi:RNA recognition motif-containing protein
MSVTVFVDNLSSGVTKEALHALFAPFGPVHAIVATHRDGRHLGFGFVVCYTTAAAEQAIAALNGTDVMGSRIRVSPTLSPSPYSSPD